MSILTRPVPHSTLHSTCHAVVMGVCVGGGAVCMLILDEILE